MEREYWEMRDGKKVSVCIWDKAKNPTIVLQTVHGMAEHAARYDRFATYLNALGIIVVADDHRAHGHTAEEGRLGKADDTDLFMDSVGDEQEITQHLLERYKLPIVLLGHSYGSFITQRYLSLGSELLSGVILMGSAAMEGFLVNFGNAIASSKFKKGKKDEEGDFFARLTFESYDKKVRDGKNGWLSRDVKEVGKYNVDPLCGFTCSIGFYKYFFGGLKAISADDGSKIGKDIKMLIVSGGHDYVGGKGKLVKKLAERYRGFGLSVDMRLYEGARHEIVNETNYEEVYKDVADFVLSCKSK